MQYHATQKAHLWRKLKFERRDQHRQRSWHVDLCQLLACTHTTHALTENLPAVIGQHMDSKVPS